MTNPSLRDARILVTGATGFLGSHLVRRLHAEGARVHALVRTESSRDRIANLIDSIHVVEAELQNQAAIDRAVERARPGIVLHAAGFTGGRQWRDAASPALLESSYAVNLMGTMRLLLAVCRGAPSARVIRIGGIEEYGRGPLPGRERQREAPTSAYSASQTAATHLAEMFHRRFGLWIATLRPSLIYGPGQATTFFIPSLIAACLANGRFDVQAADHTRDFVYVDDVVDACVLAAATDDIDGELINISSGREYRIRDITGLIASLAGGQPDIRLATGTRPFEPERLVIDPALARERLGWQATTSIEEGLERTIAWYRSATSSSSP